MLTDTTTDAGASATFVDAARARLTDVADPERAPQMQAYMKSALPYFGVSAKPMRRVAREVIRAHPLPSFDAWRATITALVDGAEHREEWYVAVELGASARYRKLRVTLDALPLWEHVIVTTAWWDIVDTVAAHRLGELLGAFPGEMTPTLRAWAQDGHLWKRRASILSQLRAKDRTDRDLLYGCIEPNLERSEFWLRKAIGWALREYAKTDPDEVRRYVSRHESRLSGLSRREALKNL